MEIHHTIRLLPNHQPSLKVLMQKHQIKRLSNYTRLIAADRLHTSQLLQIFFPASKQSKTQVPEAIKNWLQKLSAQNEYLPREALVVVTRAANIKLYVKHRSADNCWLIEVRLFDLEIALETFETYFRLTPHEAEVVYWVMQGKTNNEIGEIVGSAGRTVTKHLEHIVEKMGVPNRTAIAVAIADLSIEIALPEPASTVRGFVSDSQRVKTLQIIEELKMSISSANTALQFVFAKLQVKDKKAAGTKAIEVLGLEDKSQTRSEHTEHILGDPKALRNVRVLKEEWSLNVIDAEILYWIALSRTIDQTVELVGIGPGSINQRLLKIFKLIGVSNRKAAADLIKNHVPRGLESQFDFNFSDAILNDPDAKSAVVFLKNHYKLEALRLKFCIGFVKENYCRKFQKLCLSPETKWIHACDR